MKIMYTHLEAKEMTKNALIKECIRLAGRCGKVVSVESLSKYSQPTLYRKYLKIRNEYVLFYK